MFTLSSRRFLAAALGAASALTVISVATPSAAAPPPPGYRTDEILATAINPALGNIPIRRGFWDADTDKGWGYDKARHKHNIYSIYAQKRVLMSPNYEQQGTSYALRAWAGRYRCSGSNCTLVEQREVRGVYMKVHQASFHGWPVNGIVGLQTMYCLNPQAAPQCPNWVVPAIERPGTPARGADDRTKQLLKDVQNGEAALRTSYKPLPRRIALDRR